MNKLCSHKTLNILGTDRRRVCHLYIVHRNLHDEFRCDHLVSSSILRFIQ